MNTDGKIVLITGATSGIGLAVSKKLASLKATVVMIGRNPAKSLDSWKEVAAAAKGPAPVLFTSDFSEQKNIAELASSLQRKMPRIDVLINNAGAIFSEKDVTIDGVER